MQEPDCIFCEIAAGRKPASIVFQDELTMAFIDLRQFHPGHTLVIPRRHFRDVRELDRPTGAALMATVSRITQTVGDVFPNEGLSLWHSIGEAAFQEVPHLHIHIHPRFREDGVLQVYPQAPAFPDQPKRDQYAARLRERLEKSGLASGKTRSIPARIPHVGVGCIVERKGEFLLVRDRRGSWSTPGGHLDFGETPEACAARETLEETGVPVKNVQFVAITNDILADSEKHYITIWMRGEPDDVAPVIGDTAEIAEAGWFAPDAFPAPLHLYFENLLAGRSLPRVPGNLFSTEFDALET